jgi:hypothetical protein
VKTFFGALARLPFFADFATFTEGKKFESLIAQAIF